MFEAVIAFGGVLFGFALSTGRYLIQRKSDQTRQLAIMMLEWVGAVRACQFVDDEQQLESLHIQLQKLIWQICVLGNHELQHAVLQGHYQVVQIIKNRIFRIRSANSASASGAETAFHLGCISHDADKLNEIANRMVEACGRLLDRDWINRVTEDISP
ncbi:MAG: hypothetical protein ED559_05510 [Phycisphaera sp.]|nr:MAG: hypothetical protein ED559_05510 [Phycisphaera sp.]